MGFEYVRGDEADEWLPKQWRLTTFPVSKEPASGPKDIIGSSFILRYKGKIFLVSARHVVEGDSLVLVMPTKKENYKPIPLRALEEEGIGWVHHPHGFDLSAILFQTHILEELEVRCINEKYWITQPTLSIGMEVKHLGFPDKDHANYLDGRIAPFPIGMKGEIIDFKGFSIHMKTAGGPGASGGPVIIRKENDEPHLVGVVTDIRLYGQKTRPSEAIRLNETVALPISLVKDILESYSV